MEPCRVERQLGRETLSIESGKLARQASGAALVRYGDTVTLVASVGAPGREGLGFFPLTVDYREKTYAAGKFPGGFIKREGRPTTKEILTMRLMDRPLRPLFPDHYKDEVQVQAMVLSADRQNDPDVLSIIGASASLYVSPIPFMGPIGAVRVGRIDGELVAMPTHHELEQSDLDLVVAGTEEAIIMIEGFAREMSEAEMLDALRFAHDQLRIVIDMQRELRDKLGLPRVENPAPQANPLYDLLMARGQLGGELSGGLYDVLRAKKLTSGKQDRAAEVSALRDRVLELLGAPNEAGLYTVQGLEPFKREAVLEAFSLVEQKVVRDLILAGTRPDGRDHKTVREITCEVGVLPRTHGSAVFTRGETQALVAVTLGTTGDEQRVDGLADEYSKKFMLDYNFPPFSVGEVRPIRGPGRREIGHGALAERSLKSIIPNPEDFPYTVRVVSDILESNGSSSMATVCGGTLALMDAGVPISDPVAGVSIGLVSEKDGRYALLTDIIGDEDHFGDMDFKIAGTQRGITGIQLDLKIAGLSDEIIVKTLEQAREARMEILRAMLRTIKRPRQEISPHAPRLIQIRISPDKIGLLIGPGGKTIKGLQEATGATIEVEDDGTVTIACIEAEGAEAARAKIEAMTEEVQVGKIYDGKVISIKEFGCFVEILPGRDGLVHISELSDNYVQQTGDVCSIGDMMPVKVILIDDQDRVKLSRRQALRELGQEDTYQGGPPRGERGPQGDRGGDRGPQGDRGGDRGGDRDRGRGRGYGGDRGGRGREHERSNR